MAGMLLGAVTVGLAVLARKTPPDQWGETLRRITTDAIAYVKSRYGTDETMALVEKTLEKYQDTARETTLSHAFSEAAAEGRKDES
jgi:SLT domain-containing protein